MAGARPANNGNRSTNRVGATVSRRLRAEGWNISPSARKYRYSGIFVTGHGDSVSVLLDLGLAAKNRRYAGDIEATVRTWAQTGDVVEMTVLDDGSVFVRFTYGS